VPPPVVVSWAWLRRHSAHLCAAPVASQTKLDEIFNKHDTDGSGTLETSELLGVMQEYANKFTKAGDEHIPIDEDDVQHILEACDADGDKTVGRDELLPALATWREIVTDRRSQLRESMQQAEAERVEAERQAEQARKSERKKSLLPDGAAPVDGAAKAKSGVCVLL